MITITAMNKTDRQLKKYRTSQTGVTLLITLLVMGVMLVISASLLHITIKQFQFSGISEISEIAFNAANSGMECALFFDLGFDTGVRIDAFDVPGDGTPQSAAASIVCMNVADSAPAPVVSGQPQDFEFEWNGMCTQVTVYKFLEDEALDGDAIGPDLGGILSNPPVCLEGQECTVIKSRGYNTTCGNLSDQRVVERELTLVY